MENLTFLSWNVNGIRDVQTVSWVVTTVLLNCYLKSIKKQWSYSHEEKPYR